MSLVKVDDPSAKLKKEPLGNRRMQGRGTVELSE
jgi:hypothetical protein